MINLLFYKVTLIIYVSVFLMKDCRRRDKIRW